MLQVTVIDLPVNSSIQSSSCPGTRLSQCKELTQILLMTVLMQYLLLRLSNLITGRRAL